VLHVEALDQPDGAVVHHHRKPLDRGPARALEHVLHAAIELEPRGGLLELSFGVLERIQLAVDGHGHGSLDAPIGRGNRTGVVRTAGKPATPSARPACGPRAGGPPATPPAPLADCRGPRNARTSAGPVEDIGRRRCAPSWPERPRRRSLVPNLKAATLAG